MCLCRKGARCLECIEEDGLTKSPRVLDSGPETSGDGCSNGGREEAATSQSLDTKTGN